jgi:Toprim domain
MFSLCSKWSVTDSSSLGGAGMADQIVITEKTSQAKDIRAAVGTRYGEILPAEGHLFDLLEPEDVVLAWKHWSPILLRPEALYGTRPAKGGNKAAKLKAIREALRTVKRVWLATDCDREGQLIGQEILEHYKYRGEVMRVLFTAQDLQTIRDAFGRAKPNVEYSRLYAAAVARRQADQIYNLSLTRTATVILSCCRFDGHRDWVFHEAGGELCRDEDSAESSRSRRSSLSGSVGYLWRKPAETWAFMRTCCANG